MVSGVGGMAHGRVRVRLVRGRGKEDGASLAVAFLVLRCRFEFWL